MSLFSRNVGIRSVLVAAFFAVMLSGPNLRGQSYDLTGYWQSDQDTTYKFRQVGDELFWFVDYLPQVTNVFHGTIAGNIITGKWADLPGGQRAGQGTVALRIESNDYIVKISETGTYGGTFWRRTGSPTTTSGPTEPPTPPGPEPQPQSLTAIRCKNFAGSSSCNQLRWAGGNSGMYTVYPTSGGERCEYEMKVDARTTRRSGEVTFEPDPEFPEDNRRLVIRMRSTMASNNVGCTMTGKLFGEEVTDAKFSCDDYPNRVAGANWVRSQPKACTDAGLTTGPPADLAPVFDSVPGLGRWWMVYGADNWLGMWTRREDSDTFDGEWRRGNATVRTLARIVRTGDRVTITREQSTDGQRCLFEGDIRGTGVTGSYRCAAPGGDYGRQYEFHATIHP